MPESIRLRQQKLDVVTLAEAVDWIHTAVAVGPPMRLIHTANLDHYRLGERDAEFAEVASRADLSLADGAPLSWAAKLAFGTTVPRVTGQDLFVALARDRRRALRVYLLGAAPDVNARALDRLASDDWPGLEPVGGQSPERAELDGARGAEVVRAINDARPDLLLVALGAPTQECWLWRHRADLQVAVAVGLGSTLDVFVGNAKRAPVPMQRAGLEWLYRLEQEPARLAKRYLVHDSRAAADLFTYSLRRRWTAAGAAPASPEGSRP